MVGGVLARTVGGAGLGRAPLAPGGRPDAAGRGRAPPTDSGGGGAGGGTGARPANTCQPKPCQTLHNSVINKTFIEMFAFKDANRSNPVCLQLICSPEYARAPLCQGTAADRAAAGAAAGAAGVLAQRSLLKTSCAAASARGLVSCLRATSGNQFSVQPSLEAKPLTPRTRS